jgi:hypothetical protein
MFKFSYIVSVIRIKKSSKLRKVPESPILFSVLMVELYDQFENFIGKLCAYFMENGTFKIVKSENGDLLYEMKNKNCLDDSVTSACWINYNLMKDLGDLNDFKKYPTLNSLIIQLGPHIKSER